MGEMNEQDEGTDSGWPIGRIEYTGLPLPIGLKAVPFLEGVGPTLTDELAKVTFVIPDDTALRLAPTIIRVDVPQALLHAWAAHTPQPLADSIAAFRHDLQEADRHMEQVVRVGDHLAKIMETVYRCLHDQERSIVAIPHSDIALGELMLSAIAWWDKERHQEIGKEVEE